MPKVGKKHFSYTKSGKKKAAAYAKRRVRRLPEGNKTVDGGLLLSSHKSSFCAELRYEDLQRLRAVARKFFETKTKRHKISDIELDKWIESKGPVVREKLIKHAVDNRLG